MALASTYSYTYHFEASSILTALATDPVNAVSSKGYSDIYIKPTGYAGGGAFTLADVLGPALAAGSEWTASVVTGTNLPADFAVPVLTSPYAAFRWSTENSLIDILTSQPVVGAFNAFYDTTTIPAARMPLNSVFTLVIQSDVAPELANTMGFSVVAGGSNLLVRSGQTGVGVSLKPGLSSAVAISDYTLAPEPGTFLAAGAGIVCLLLARRRARVR